MGDVDGDGDIDVYVVTDGDDVLLLNNGAVWEQLPTPQAPSGSSDAATMIPNWNGQGQAAIFVANGRGLIPGPRQFIIVAKTLVPLQRLPRRELVVIDDVPVILSWYGVEGIDRLPLRFEIQQRVDGGDWKPVRGGIWIETGSTRYAIRLYRKPGHRFLFRIRPATSFGNDTTWSSGSEFNITTYQEPSDKIEYLGNWTNWASGSALDGALRYTASANRTATMHFYGTSVAWVSTVGPDRGRAQIVLDGNIVAVVDLYDPIEKFSQITFAANNLATGSHKLKVHVLRFPNAASSGNRVDIDAFVVLD